MKIKHSSHFPCLIFAGAKKKKDTASNEEDSKSSEHRENLNERLKREFGFDVSEGIFITPIISSHQFVNE